MGDTPEEDMHRACAGLRFAEGLRRRSAEARAEASIREACGIAALEGARVDPDRLREAIFADRDGLRGADELPADLVIGLGSWRAAWTAASALPELNSRSRSIRRDPPLRAVAAGIQRDYGSLLVARGLCAADALTLPRDPERWARVLASIEAAPGAPNSATERAAIAWALLALEEPFAVGNRVMGVLLAKHILASEGVEPTAVSVISLLAIERAGEYRMALEQAVAGTWEPWFAFFRASVERGCEVGQRVTLQVQAGQLG